MDKQRVAQVATLVQMAKHYFYNDFRMVPANYAARRWAKAMLEAWSGAPILYLTVYHDHAAWLALLIAEELKSQQAEQGSPDHE